MAEVFVVGSINQDFVLRVARRPAPGETVTGADLALFAGGKGANQAVAAARLGATVGFLGAVGQDPFGDALVRGLADEDIQTATIRTVPGVATGAAFITITPDGENAIVVSPGANRHVTIADVEACATSIRAARALVLQMELPLDTVRRAVELGAAAGTRVILNLAPLPATVPPALLQPLDPLVVNEHEAAALLGRPIADVPDALRAATDLLALGPRSAIITLGSAGAVLASPDATATHIPAPIVPVVDTTAAGDAFVGALALMLARDATRTDAVAYAVRAGAAAVTKPGAQASLPTAADVATLG